MHTHTHTHIHKCVWHAVRAKRAARLTATFCSLPFYFLPFLTLAQHMQAYMDKAAEGEEKRGGGVPCTLQACFAVQMFYNGAGIPDIYSIRFSVHAKGIFAIFRVSLFIRSSSSFCFCTFSTCNAKVSCEWGNCFLTSRVITTLYSYFFGISFETFPPLKLKIKPECT